MDNAVMLALVNLVSFAMGVLAIHLKNKSQDAELSAIKIELADLKKHHHDCTNEVVRLRALIHDKFHIV